MKKTTNQMGENAERDLVRENTAAHINRRLDHQAEERVQSCEGSDRQQITSRIEELEREWDIERVLEVNAAALSLAGVGAAAATGNKKWLIVPGVVLPFLIQHAVQGWCPPIPVFRRLGVRTKQEIERERYRLKTLRGDFDDDAAEKDAPAALQSVMK